MFDLVRVLCLSVFSELFSSFSFFHFLSFDTFLFRFFFLSLLLSLSRLLTKTSSSSKRLFPASKTLGLGCNAVVRNLLKNRRVQHNLMIGL